MNNGENESVQLISKRNVQPAYLKIAYDIARRIAHGEIAEGTRFFGRSVMSSEYGVSPETIRRALSLLSEKKVVEIYKNSGVTVLSKVNAQSYMNYHSTTSDSRNLVTTLSNLLEQQKNLSKEIYRTAQNLSRSKQQHSSSFPYNFYEIPIESEAPLCNRTLSEIEFWQKTGATVIAVKRDDRIILSPGSGIIIYENDILVIVGEEESRTLVQQLVSKPII